MPSWSSHLSLPPLLLFPPHLCRNLQMKKSQGQLFAVFLFCKRNFHFLFPLPYFLLNPHGFSWVVDILRVDGSLLVSVLLLLLGVVHHHVVLEDEAEVDRRVVCPVKINGIVGRRRGKNSEYLERTCRESLRQCNVPSSSLCNLFSSHFFLPQIFLRHLQTHGCWSRYHLLFGFHKDL